jgi:hypothetical protein
MSMMNNIVGYWAYIRGTYIRGGLIFVGGGAYIWNEVSVIFRESEVYSIQLKKACDFFVIDTHFWVHIEQL